MRRACKYALVKMAALFVAQYSEQVLFANLLRALQRHTLNESERNLSLFSRPPDRGVWSFRLLGRVLSLGPCLVAFKISNFYKIPHHIESLNVCMEY